MIILELFLFVAFVFWVMAKVEKLFPPHHGVKPMSEAEDDK